MRIWLDPDKLTQLQHDLDDVVAAVRAYNVEVSAGQFGGVPAVPGQRLNASILVQSLLRDPRGVRRHPAAHQPRRLGGPGQRRRPDRAGHRAATTCIASYNGRPAAGIAIRQEAGANALDTADAIKAARWPSSRALLPPGMKVDLPLRHDAVRRVAIDEVVKTLLEAILLVFLVMYLFMGNIRATLVPTIAVPVVILGTFGVLGCLGYSINMLTMFAMVLAIGLLVDDAIVVVENVERVMSEEGLPPREATAQVDGRDPSALVGIGLVLAAVFGPWCSSPARPASSTGSSRSRSSPRMLLSVVVALILTRRCCARRCSGRWRRATRPPRPAFRLLRPFFLWFDRLFYRPARPLHR